jgi:zinc transport system ATP-binding protein
MALKQHQCPEAIAVERLTFGYDPRQPVLEDVSFRIPRGQMVACIGPNGGGKTTLLRLLLGFLKPESGTISLLENRPQAVLQKIAYVPQAQRYDRLFPISALDVVLMGLLRELRWTGRFSRSQRERAHSALESVGLADLANVCFGSLSGGQAQRVLIARALVSDPELLFLDEPTASVDPAAEEQIYQLLQSLRGSRTIFQVTHDLRTAHSEVDTVLCVQREVVMIAPEQLCQHFSMGLFHRTSLRGQGGAKA